MSATLTTDISRFIIAGVDEIFRKNWDSYPIQHKNFTKYKKATRETMNYDQTGNLPTASVMEESAPFVFNKMTQGYSTAIKCTQIGAGIAFSLKARKFDLYDVIDESKVKELAHSLRDYEEVVATRPLNQAFTLNLADGKPLCAKDKPLVNHATLKNNTVTTGTFKGASGYENIKDGVKMFSQFKNHAGNPIVSCPDKFITHEVNMMDAEEIFNSSKKPFTSENTVNGLPGLKPYQDGY